MNYSKQVGKDHYSGISYRSKDRWFSYWHQIGMVRKIAPEQMLEIGVGDGVVARELAHDGIKVTTLDIAAELNPDVVGSVTELPFGDNSFDTVLAAEILEHIRFEDVPRALSEIARVARTHIIITLPHPGYVFSFTYKIPLFPRFEFLIQIPFFWKRHIFNGEHYWELGKRGYPLRRFLQYARDAGLNLVECEKYADDPAHRFFLFSLNKT